MKRNPKNHPDARPQEDIDQMLYLRFTKRWSLADIGQYFGVSRERIRQIIGNTGRLARNKYWQHLGDPDWLAERSHMSDEEIAKEIGLPKRVVSSRRQGTIRPLSGEDDTMPVHVGRKGEEWVMDMFSDMEWPAELMPYGAPYDVDVFNGVRVDIKTASRPFKSYESLVNPCWSFHVGDRHKWDECDFFIFLIAHEWSNVTPFIIPAGELKKGGTRQHVRFVYPTDTPHLSHWQNFESHWHRISEFAMRLQ